MPAESPSIFLCSASRWRNLFILILACVSALSGRLATWSSGGAMIGTGCVKPIESDLDTDDDLNMGPGSTGVAGTVDTHVAIVGVYSITWLACLKKEGVQARLLTKLV